jgi:hypothetical protein
MEKSHVDMMFALRNDSDVTVLVEDVNKKKMKHYLQKHDGKSGRVYFYLIKRWKVVNGEKKEWWFVNVGFNRLDRDRARLREKRKEFGIYGVFNVSFSLIWEGEFEHAFALERFIHYTFKEYRRETRKMNLTVGMPTVISRECYSLTSKVQILDFITHVSDHFGPLA